jgi:hypothetical protein
MLHERWSAEAWSVVRVEFRRALALRSQIRRAGWNLPTSVLSVNESLAFLYLKVEDQREPYHDIAPAFTPKKRVKIGTLKVELNGFKLGERLLKVVFDNALVQRVDEIYVTIFPRSILKTPGSKRVDSSNIFWGSRICDPDW